MSPNLIDAYRALAGVAGSDKIETSIKQEAEDLMKEIMKVMQISIQHEKKQLKEFVDHVNSGLIT